MKTEHLDKLLSNPATPYWVTEVSRRLERVDIVDAINGLEALARTLDADHKAHIEQQLARHQRKLTAQASKQEWTTRDAANACSLPGAVADLLNDRAENGK